MVIKAFRDVRAKQTKVLIQTINTSDAPIHLLFHLYRIIRAGSDDYQSVCVRIKGLLLNQYQVSLLIKRIKWFKKHIIQINLLPILCNMLTLSILQNTVYLNLSSKFDLQ